METNKKVDAGVISPSKDGHKRQGKGFSLLEIKQSGKSIELLREYKLDIDYMRRSSHAVNVDILKKLKPVSKKAKKREPFVYKEKKKTPFIIKEGKPKVKPTKIEKEEIITEENVKKASITKEKVKIKKEKPKKEELEREEKPLSLLSGLGPTTEAKFKELGVDNLELLVKEDPTEISALIKGVSQDRIKKWIDEAKELLK
jgi:predicted flap endonuclease-1-like 5' DNA nuclease